jgi:hypothetical protein
VTECVRDERGQPDDVVVDEQHAGAAGHAGGGKAQVVLVVRVGVGADVPRMVVGSATPA